MSTPFTTFATLVDGALEVQQTVYGKWRESAKFSIEQFGTQWLMTKDSNAMAKLSKDEKASVLATQKELRNIVTTRAEARGHSNPRKVWADFTEYAREAAGMPSKKKVKGGKTSYDHVCEALRTLRNHMPECDNSEVSGIYDEWKALEESAEYCGLLKPQE